MLKSGGLDRKHDIMCKGQKNNIHFILGIIRFFRFCCYLCLVLIFTLSSSGFVYKGKGLIRESFEYDTKNPAYVPNELLVEFKPNTSDKVKYEGHERCGALNIYPSYDGRFEKVKFGPDKSVQEMIEAYKLEPCVLYAEPNYITYAFFVPNDPLYRYQWHLQSPENGGINMEPTWDISTGKDVIVAILDTGVAYENYKSFRLAPDLNGTRFIQGYDFVDKDTHPNDEDGHGTHVAGTIAQRTNNNMGLAGIAFNCTIMPVRVLGADGSGTHFTLADGIDFAVKNGAKVINMSLGNWGQSDILKQSLAHAYEMGVILVAAAGNEFFEGSPASYPAAYNDYCIAVGAVRYDGMRAPYSNVSDYIDITAPGGDITVDQNHDGYVDGIYQQTFTTDPQRFGYYFFEGTSMAAPHVSATAALLISNGVTNPNDVIKALKDTARDMGPLGCDSEYGWGILNAYDAIIYSKKVLAQDRDIAITAIKTTEEIISGNTLKINVIVRNNSFQSEDVE
jgi:serine protease